MTKPPFQGSSNSKTCAEPERNLHLPNYVFLLQAFAEIAIISQGETVINIPLEVGHMFVALAWRWGHWQRVIVLAIGVE